MANITSAEVVKFCNEDLRPVCETIRNLKAKMENLQLQYYNTISAEIGGNTGVDDMLIDNREEQGVTQIDGNDISGVITQTAAIIALLEEPGVMNVIEKPCVRALNIF